VKTNVCSFILLLKSFTTTVVKKERKQFNFALPTHMSTFFEEEWAKQ